MGFLPNRSLRHALFGASIAAISFAIAGEAAAEPRQFNVPADDAVEAIPEFARQAGVQIIAPADQLRGIRTPEVSGQMEPRDALRQLLAGTGLEIVSDDGRIIALRQSNPTQLGDASGASSSDRDGGATSDILVIGRRTLNADIRRTEDDAQPYVVFDAEEIGESGALSVSEFLRTRLPMNAEGGVDTNRSVGGAGRINLRGLGANQTLILVDGRRLAGISQGTDFGQPNINGIPPSAIERIEILPATASAAYGGGATGGVVNIILKRDYSGLNVDALYGVTSRGDAERNQVALTGGFSLEDGRTRVMATYSHADQGDLFSTDRDFANRALTMLQENRPASVRTFAYGPLPIIISNTGANLVYDPAYGGASLNSPWTHVPSGYGGIGTDNAAGLAANAGDLNAAGIPDLLLGARIMDAYSLSIRREFSRDVEAYLDLYGDRAESESNTPQGWPMSFSASSPYNPFQQAVTVNMTLADLRLQSRSEVETFRANAGVIFRLDGGWSGVIDYGYNENETMSWSESIEDVTEDGWATLESIAFSDIRDLDLDWRSLFYLGDTYTPTQNAMETLSIRISGPLLQLPGGAVTGSGLLEQREQSTDGYTRESEFRPSPRRYRWTPPASQNVQSAYAEVRAPIVSELNSLPFVAELEVMASVRRDEYQTDWAAIDVDLAGPDGPYPPQAYTHSELESTDYTLGLRYSPVSDLTFRASFGTGFMPPSLALLRATSTTGSATALIPSSIAADPRRGGEPLLGDPVTGIITRISGGNPNLDPEESESLSYGFIFQPSFLEGLRISLDYTQTEKTGEIQGQTYQYFLDNEASYPDRIVRAPLTPADQLAGFTGGRIIYFDQTAVNIAATTSEAYDLQIDYNVETERFGDWRFYVVATRQTTFERQSLPTSPTADAVGDSDGPLAWRGNGGIDLSLGNWTFGWNAQYYDGYSLCDSLATPADCAARIAVISQGTDQIPDQIYHDAFVRYRFDPASLVGDAEIAVGVQNLFDESPPIVTPSGYSFYGDPRLQRFTLNIRKQF